MADISRNVIQKGATMLLIGLFAFLCITSLWLIIIEYISRSYLSDAESIRVFEVGVALLGVILSSTLTLFLIFLYRSMSKTQQEQTEVLIQQQKLMEAEYVPDIRIIDKDGEIDLIDITLSNERGGLATNLTVISYISTGDQLSHTRSEYEASGELMEKVDEETGVRTVFNGLFMPDQARGHDEDRTQRIEGSFLHPTGEATDMMAHIFAEIVSNGERVDSGNYMRIIQKLMEDYGVEEVGIYSFLCYRDMTSEVHVKVIDSNYPIRNGSLDNQMRLFAGERSAPKGLENRVRRAYRSWLLEESES